MNKQIVILEDTNLNIIIKQINEKITTEVEAKACIRIRDFYRESERVHVDSMLRKAYVSIYQNSFSKTQENKAYGNTLAAVLEYSSHDILFKAIKESKHEVFRDSAIELLPCYTPNGFFVNQRFRHNLLNTNKFICIDINANENRHIINFKSLQTQLANITNLAFCNSSPFVEGYYCLFPTEGLYEHELYFHSISSAFKQLGIIVDKSCKDVTKIKNLYVDPKEYRAETAWTIQEVLLTNINTTQSF